MTWGAAADERLRAAAFAFLDRLLETKGAVKQEDLSHFSFDGLPLRLLAPQQGIWKPRQLSAALSFRTVFTSNPSNRPYDDDDFGPDGFPRYKWRGPRSRSP